MKISFKNIMDISMKKYISVTKVYSVFNNMKIVFESFISKRI